MAAALAGRGLRLAFGETSALRDVDIEVGAGEMVAVMGPSGSGKSTLLHVLAGILAPDAGEVWYEERRLDSLDDARRSTVRLARMGFVFQDPGMLPELTLLENVALPLEVLGWRRSAARAAAAARLSELGVDEAASRRVTGAVSGGQAQRAAIARAVVGDPAVVFADEPTGALDRANGARVMDLLATLRAGGIAVLVVTHDPEVASRADRVVRLLDGRLDAS